jgi:hypothetical protein
VINIRLLTTLNIACSEAERSDVIDTLSDYIEAGTIVAVTVGDSIESFRLTEEGRMAYATQVRDNLRGLV